jgi:hypothetical protein
MVGGGTSVATPGSRYPPGVTSPMHHISAAQSTTSSRQQQYPLSALSSVHDVPESGISHPSYGHTYEGPSEEHKTIMSASIHDELMMDRIEGIQGESDAQNGDVEVIIMNLYSKMKNLEGKYIDLANFYKQELVKSNKKPSNPD